MNNKIAFINSISVYINGYSQNTKTVFLNFENESFVSSSYCKNVQIVLVMPANWDSPVSRVMCTVFGKLSRSVKKNMVSLYQSIATIFFIY